MTNTQTETVRLPKAWTAWEIIRPVSAGTYGTVYEARLKTNPSCKSAVKMIQLPDNAAESELLLHEYHDKDAVLRFYRGLAEEYRHEADMLNTLKDCPNIVQAQDFCIEEREDMPGYTIYLRMEFLTPFHQYCENHPLDETTVTRLGIDLCAALFACHEQGIIHRDIKPGNILVAENGSFKLGDFGVAKNISRTAGTLSAKGTYAFMAPEVYRGGESMTNARISTP